jgi:hypothetical protein
MLCTWGVIFFVQYGYSRSSHDKSAVPLGQFSDMMIYVRINRHTSLFKSKFKALISNRSLSENIYALYFDSAAQLKHVEIGSVIKGEFLLLFCATWNTYCVTLAALNAEPIYVCYVAKPTQKWMYCGYFHIVSSLGLQINKCLKCNLNVVYQITRVITDLHETAALSALSTSQAYRNFTTICRNRIP